MFILEGNIGAGKSTLLNHLAQNAPHIHVLPEPVHAWHSNDHAGSLLSNFYENPERWAYTMETFTMVCRVSQHRKDQQSNYPYSISERSIYSGHYCFALNSYKQGFMNNLEWHLYEQVFKTLVTEHCTPPKGFIYLRAHPEKASERITKRSRSGESTISLEYLERIHEQHDAFLLHKQNVLESVATVPVLVVDGNPDLDNDPAAYTALAQEIAAFMYQHGGAQTTRSATQEQR